MSASEPTLEPGTSRPSSPAPLRSENRADTEVDEVVQSILDPITDPAALIQAFQDCFNDDILSQISMLKTVHLRNYLRGRNVQFPVPESFQIGRA